MNKLIAKLKNQFNNKKVLVVGLGLQGGGVGLVHFFSSLGANVTVTDLKTKEKLKKSINKLSALNIKYTLGKHKISDFTSSEYIFKGPSVKWDLPELVCARKKGVKIDMEASFFVKHCPSTVIGISGTRGKSTTTMMLYSLLKKSKKKVFLGGNIPNISTIKILKSVTSQDYVILELSSWQLSGLNKKKISPNISVFTNLYPDHLNYYHSMNDYVIDKKALYLNQKSSDYLIANKALKKEIEKDNPKSKIYYFQNTDFQKRLKYLKGVHNKENAACVLIVAKILKINKKCIEEHLINFKGIPYRQEIIGSKNNIIFVNDTTSTTPIATIKAIDSFFDSRIILILGGKTKGLPTSKLLKKLNDVEKIVLLKGSFTSEIYKILNKKIKEKISGEYDDLGKAVEKAYKIANKIKDKYKEEVIVLFSPGATSFELFDNEFHRGKEFNRIYKRI